MKQTRPLALERQPKLSAWLKLNPDNTVTVFTGKVELGQGIHTALAQIVAEELELALDQIVMAEVSTRHTPDEGYTAGSASLEQSGVALRLVASQLHTSLKMAAARTFDLDVTSLWLQAGKVWQPGSDAPRCCYADLIPALDPDEHYAGQGQPKVSYHTVGHSLPRLDIPGKVSGSFVFIHDLKLPNMVHGRVLRAPHYGARLTSIDTGRVTGDGLIKVEQRGSFVGLIAEQEYQAIRALDALRQQASWESRELPQMLTLDKHLRQLPTEDVTVREGKPDFTTAKTVLAGSYTVPYQAHASLAPSCAIALLEDEQLTVWTHSQGIYPLRRELAKVLNWPEEQLTLIHREGPGCYGHNGADDVAADAALLALLVPGKAVRVLWSLAQELQTEPYTPAMLLDVKAGLDRQGRITAWDYSGLTDSHVGRPGGQGDRLKAAQEIKQATVAWPGPAEGGYRNAETLYQQGEVRVVTNFYQGPLRVSALRTLGAFANTFANESMMTELAYAANEDPVAFRLKHLGDARAKAVIQLAAEKAQWQTRTAATGRGQGMAFARYKNVKAYAAQVVQLRLDVHTAEIQIEQVTTVCDAGQVINPDGLTNQLEGGSVQGISRSLFEAVQLDWDGNGMQDWESYPVIGFEAIPELKTYLIDQPQLAPLGAGEAATPPMAAAIANALYDASGIRLRTLPLTPDRIRQRLASMSAEELEQVKLSTP